MSEAKPIPKSLHTVRVLVIMADVVQLHVEEGLTDEEAIRGALALLGYTNTPDTHGLKEKALKAYRAQA